MTDSQRPIETLRDGNLKASIWLNEGENGPFFTTTLSRTYTDEGGNYRDTGSFSGPELLRVAELAREAYTMSNTLRRELKSVDGGEAEPEPPARKSERGRTRARRQPR